MDGTLNPIEGRTQLIAYPAGVRSGPSVFPRTRWNKAHSQQLCNHTEFVECYKTMGQSCALGCGFVKGIDDQPQLLVANSFKVRAAKKEPAFILNVGDNFYWGGIEKTCGTPMDELSYTAHHQFDQIFEGVYNGPGLDGKVWLSVLGNHDWGGRVFNNGWDSQLEVSAQFWGFCLSFRFAKHPRTSRLPTPGRATAGECLPHIGAST